MNNVWLKIKVWTKLTVFVLFAVYVLLFFFSNSGQSVKLWVFFGTIYEISVLVLVFLTLAIGVIGTLLVGTVRNTIKQVRELRARGRAQQMEQDLAEMKAKAAKLQTRGEMTEEPPKEGT